MATQSSTLIPGTVISSSRRSYTVVRILGQGGFGITYLVTGNVWIDNIQIEARFALKEHFISSLCNRNDDGVTVQYSGPVADEVDRSLRAFTKEAGRLKELGINHPNIVRINEVFEANNTAYYVMEYLGETTLESYVKANGPLSPAAARLLLRPVAEAVGMLHDNSIAHYDIKPGNIMLHHAENGEVRPVLIDFGLSKHYNDSGHATSTLAVAGYSAGYSPAEQYAGVPEFMPQCDVYSLAATYYFCLTGHAPKDALKLRGSDVIDALVPMLGESGAAAVARAMAMVPESRTPDVESFIAEVLDNKAQPPRPVAQDSAEVVATAPIKHRVISFWTIAAAMIAASAVVGFAAYIFNLKSDREETPLIVTADSTAVEPVLPTVEKPVRTTVEKPVRPADETPVESPIETPVATASQTATEDASDVAFYFMANEDQETVCFANLDLCATRDGKTYYFNRSEWNAMSKAEQNGYDKRGVVVVGNGQAFVLSLYHRGAMTWDEAISRCGKSLPKKEQAEVMAAQHGAINSAIRAFGGDSDPEWWYWTRGEYDSSYAWVVNMKAGFLSNYNKTSSYRVRPVYKLQ